MSIDEFSRAGIDAVIEKTLSLKDWFETEHAFGAAAFYDDLKRLIEKESSNLGIVGEYLPLRRDGWIEPLSSDEAIAARTKLFIAKETEDIFFRRIPETSKRTLRDVFLFHASEDQVRELYQCYDIFLERLRSGLQTLEIEPSRDPFKNVLKLFRELSREILKIKISENAYQVAMFVYASDHDMWRDTAVQKYSDIVRETMSEVFVKHPNLDTDSVFSALAKELEEKGMSYTPGQAKKAFIKYLPTTVKDGFLSRLEKAGKRSQGLVANPDDIKESYGASAAFQENADPSAFLNKSSLEGMPYNNPPKHGIRKTFG